LAKATNTVSRQTGDDVAVGDAGRRQSSTAMLAMIVALTAATVTTISTLQTQVDSGFGNPLSRPARRCETQKRFTGHPSWRRWQRHDHHREMPDVIMAGNGNEPIDAGHDIRLRRRRRGPMNTIIGGEGVDTI